MSENPARPFSQISDFLRTPTLSRSIVALLTAALLLLLMVNLTTFFMIQRTAAFNDVVEHHQNMRRTARGVLIFAQDAETAQRGFLLTGQAEFLKPIETARLRLPERVAELKAGAGDYVELQRSAERLSDLSQAKMVELDRTILLTRSGRIGEALQLVRGG